MKRLLPVLSLVAVPWTTSAVPVPSPGSCPSPSTMAAVPARYAAPLTAATMLDSLRALHPGCLTLDLAAAREGAAAGVLDSTRDARMARLKSAVSAARAALADDSTRADTHYWLAATLGLEADAAHGRTKIRLARKAWAQAVRTLQIDPENAGAHHIMGRLHAGVERLPWVEKLIARALGLGAVLRSASWKGAEDEFRLAGRLDPNMLTNKIELGKLLIERGRVAEGDSILRDVAGRTPKNQLDAYYVREAKDLLGRG